MAIAGRRTIGNYFAFISLTIRGNLHQGLVYNIDSINTIAAFATDSTCEGLSYNIPTAYSKKGILKLNKFDTVNKIISGIFDCTFPIPNCDTLKVTNGRFDYHYHF